MVASLGRVFFAIDLGLDTRAVLDAQLADVEIPGKPVPAESWHLTLRYVGDIDEIRFDRLLAEVDQIGLGPAFEISFTDLGAFPNARRATVLWRGVQDPARRLPELVGTIEDACQAVDLPAEDRPYRPHLTLARMRPDRDVRSLVSATELPELSAPVAAVTVFRSHLGGRHARYEVMETFELT